MTEAVKAADMLAEKGIHAGVISFPCVKPLDTESVLALAERYKLLVTVEEHNIVGGFGGAVCEAAAEAGSGCRVRRIGLEDRYSSVVGTQQYLRGIYGMDAAAICEKVCGWLEK